MGDAGCARRWRLPSTCAALGEPRQRLRWHAALCNRSLESSSSAAHTLCTDGTAYCAAATAVTAMGSPSLALSQLCCGLCERDTARRLPAHCETMGVRLNHATSAWSHQPPM